MTINGKSLTAVSVGILFVWSGIKGWSVSGTLKDLITGVKPVTQTPAPLVDPNTATTVTPGGPTGSSLSDTALQYQGHAYAFGGAPGPDGNQPWDCSSFTNFVVGIKMGWAIPGYARGAYDGKTHGPATGQWAVWPGLKHITRAEVQAGDIVLWVGHMGIAISNTQMVSALNPSEGTRVTQIEGTGHGPIVVTGRLT